MTILVAITGCKRDWIEIPAPPAQLVVHGVLNPADTMQVVLVERTLTGAIGTPLVAPFTPVEPIYSDGGVAERDATGTLTAPDGTVYDAHEVSACFSCPMSRCVTQGPPCNGSGGGVYSFYLKGATLVPGGTYKLRIVTTAGEVITAETVFPAAPLSTTTVTDTFNLTTGTLALSWPTAPAPAYQVRVESPFGAWFSFTDSSRVALTANLRNPTDPNLARVFKPGFRQLLTVTAIDANMYDYYRTTNNSFVGYGSVSRVDGAMGMFGSAVTVLRRNIYVTAEQKQPIEGRFEAISTGLGYIYGGEAGALVMSIFVESPATNKNQSDAITAQTWATNPNASGIAIGTFKGSTLKLAYLRTAIDTVDVLIAELQGDTLRGKFRKGAPALYVRRP